MAVGIVHALPYKAKKSNYPLILHPILSIRDLARNYPYLILHPILHPVAFLGVKRSYGVKAGREKFPGRGMKVPHYGTKVRHLLMLNAAFTVTKWHIYTSQTYHF